MKKTILALFLIFMGSFAVKAQQPMPINYALIDSEYILSNIPQYKDAVEKMEKQSEAWNKEIQGLKDEAKRLFVKYQKEQASMSATEKQRLEEQIIEKEDQAKELQQKYFGPKGEMMTLQEQNIKPIRDAIYSAVKLIASKRAYALVLDRATGNNIIFASPEADISNDVLKVLGISR